MGKVSLPPGFRFHPTDVELVCYYLKKKIMGKPFRFGAISEIDLYKFAPWDLPEKSHLQSKDLEWYFFCPGDRKYANGLRRNRATDNGYWKTTGKDTPISHNSQTVAMRRTLVFYLGKARKGVRTDWVMHEYRSVDKKLADSGFQQDAYVVCKIYQKSGRGPKNGEQYGAPYKEEEWDDDDVNESSVLTPPMCDRSLNLQHNLLDDALQSDTHAVGNFEHYSSGCFNVNRLSQELLENNNSDSPIVQENNDAEIPDSFISLGTVANEMNIADGSGIYDGLEDLSTEPELNVADSIYFSNNTKEYALQNALLKLSNQVESEASCDIHSSSNVVEEHILYPTQLINNDGAYMEMEDFLLPVERSCSKLVDPGDLFGHNRFQNLRGTSVPAHLNVVTSSSGMEGPSGNIAGQNLVEFPGPSVSQTTDELGSAKSIHSSIGVSNRNERLPSGGRMELADIWEPHELPSEPRITNEGTSGSRLGCLFRSMPSRAAIAAEYPFALKVEKLSGGISYYTGSIDVKAEVTLRCHCTGDNQLSANDDLLCVSSGEWVPSRKITGGSHSPGNGFVFLFFLGVVSALSWIFLLTLGAKLVKSSWKFFLS